MTLSNRVIYGKLQARLRLPKIRNVMDYKATRSRQLLTSPWAEEKQSQQDCKAHMCRGSSRQVPGCWLERLWPGTLSSLPAGLKLCRKQPEWKEKGENKFMQYGHSMLHAEKQPYIYAYWKVKTNKPLWDAECISLAVTQAGNLISPPFVWRGADNALLINKVYMPCRRFPLSLALWTLLQAVKVPE